MAWPELPDGTHPPRLWKRLLDNAAALPEGSPARDENLRAAAAVRAAEEKERREAKARWERIQAGRARS